MTFYTSLTGLNAAQTELSSLSHNIANVATTGFKKGRVEFGDIVARSASQASNQVNGVGVAVAAVKQQFGQGGYAASTNALDMSITGQGFFVVKGGGDAADSITLTRNGAFTPDENGWVVDNQGRRLQVLPTTADGAVTAVGVSGLTALRLPTTSGVPEATSAVRFVANLPASADAPVAAFDPNDSASFNHATSTTVYDAAGNASNATIYYRRIESSPADSSKYWQAHAFVGDAEIFPAAGPAPMVLTFDSAGALTSPAAPVAFSGGFAIDHAGTVTSGMPFDVSFTEQDGYAPGRLESVGVDQEGVVRVSFSNGETIALGKVGLANVANPSGLKEDGNASWKLGASSGDLMIGEAGRDGYGGIMAGSLERSNVDLTEELVGLISAQRNFQANARAIDTASSLLQTIIQLRS